MKKVFFRDCGGLYLIGKVRKNYNVGDILKLKNFRSKIKVVELNKNHCDIIVKIA